MKKFFLCMLMLSLSACSLGGTVNLGGGSNGIGLGVGLGTGFRF